MKTYTHVALVILGIALTPAGVFSQDTNSKRIEIVEYGLYTASLVNKERLPDGTVRTSVSGVTHMKTTREVPTELGVRFGFRFKILGAPKADSTPLKKILIFPPEGLQPPDKTNRVFRSEVNFLPPLGEEAGYTGVFLSEAWMLIPGPWTIEIWAGDRRLVTESFIVTKQ